MLTEPGGVTVTDSDVLRFFNLGLSSYVIFYSDNDDGVDSLADSGLPSSLSTNLATVAEIGPEGLNGATYEPASSSSPGGRDGDVEYLITSDSPIPEPSTLALIGTGLIAAVWLARRRRR